jgi:hypothetical protein
MKIRLIQIETRLQTLIEGVAARLFPDTAGQNDLAHRLVAAMRDGIHTGPDGQLLAPNLFTLYVTPSQAWVLSENQGLLDGMVQTLVEAGGEKELHFPSNPVIRIAEDPDLATGEIQVVASNSLDNLPQTTDMELDRAAPPKTKDGQSNLLHALPRNAFLIVDGTEVFSLNQTVINIGRREDNQIVIDDPRISRIHAQLRAVRGHYVIFDLGSTGGTYVNGGQVHQYTLYPGDVISLSGVPLVYGQDPSGQDETQDLPPLSPDNGNLLPGHPV